MRKVFIAAIVVGFTLTACDTVGEKTGGSAGSSPKELKDVTDRRGCQGPSSPNASIFSNSWKILSTSEELAVLTELKVSQNSITMKSTCGFPDETEVEVSVDAPAIVSSSSLQILSSAKKTNPEVHGGKTYSCTAFVEAATLTYGFKGNCLALFSNGQPFLTLVP